MCPFRLATYLVALLALFLGSLNVHAGGATVGSVTSAAVAAPLAKVVTVSEDESAGCGVPVGCDIILNVVRKLLSSSLVLATSSVTPGSASADRY